MPTIFGSIYHQKPGIAGLHYLALGVGLSGASQVNARMLDKIYIYFQKKNGGVGRPEFRLREFLCLMSYFLPHLLKGTRHCCTASMVPGTICLPVGLLITGWTVERHVFWFLSDIVSTTLLHWSKLYVLKIGQQGIALVAAGTILNFQCIQSYVIDAFTLHAASGMGFSFSC